MYTIAVKRDFVAQHYLIGGDWGAENEKHSHHYQVEVQLKGESLDEHGYLVDIVKISDHLEKLVSRYRDRTLNELPELEGLNPSIEHLARVSFEALRRVLHDVDFKIKVWEDDIAWVVYQED